MSIGLTLNVLSQSQRDMYFTILEAAKELGSPYPEKVVNFLLPKAKIVADTSVVDPQVGINASVMVEMGVVDSETGSELTVLYDLPDAIATIQNTHPRVF